MPRFARGPETELANVKELEDLKQMLAKKHIHIDPSVLQRAIIMPKDLNSTEAVYPGIEAMLS